VGHEHRFAAHEHRFEPHEPVFYVLEQHFPLITSTILFRPYNFFSWQLKNMTFEGAFFWGGGLRCNFIKDSFADGYKLMEETKVKNGF
jgi:hypothetical protein